MMNYNGSEQDFDKLAWRVICSWPRYTSVQTHLNHLDFSLLSRFFLWDKVGRAIRRETVPGAFPFERKLYRPSIPELPPQNMAASNKWRVSRPFEYINSFLARAKRSVPGKKLVYAPLPNARIKQVVTRLLDDEAFRVLVPEDHVPNYPGACIAPPVNWRPYRSQSFIENLYRGILTGLSEQKIVLERDDCQLLRAQLHQQSWHLEQLRVHLQTIRPDMVLVHTDNHPPYQNYVCMARSLGIKTMQVQHGLDCERYYLDDLYASTTVVWGPERQMRYAGHRPISSADVMVTGNPGYDNLRYPLRLERSGQYWLWLTRPHLPEKCFSPSRLPKEGLDILDALILALKNSRQGQTLVIKPHPSDYAELYEKRICEEGLNDQIFISSNSVCNLLPDASAVVSEDSTAALEAMFYGKGLIHAHFSDASPVLPLVGYGAALPGYKTEMLQVALARVEKMSGRDFDDMLSAQARFINDFAGPMDGNAAKRIIAVVKREIYSN